MPASPVAATLLALQRTAGNRAVRRYLQRQAASLGALPEGERQRIVVSDSPVTRHDLRTVHEFFREVRPGSPSARMDLPRGVAIRFGAGVAQAARFRRGLTSVAAWLTSHPDPPALRPNQTIALALDLRGLGDDQTVFRFTWVARRRGGDVIVERLGPLAAAARRPTGAADPRRRKFARHRFRRGSGFREGEFNVVLEAVATVPDAILTLVDGLRFRRGHVYQRDPEAAGHYDTDDHAITLFDHAFRSRREERAQRYDRPGPEFVPLAVVYVLHELGHAIDLAPLRAAWRTFENAGQTAAAQAVLERARSRAGYRWALRGDVWEIVAGAGGSRFRTVAGGNRGTRITQYANRDWGEYYAESFALFMADPTLLEHLRPSVYDTFARDFADPDRPPRPAPAAAPRQRPRRPAGVARSARTAPPALAPPSRR